MAPGSLPAQLSGHDGHLASFSYSRSGVSEQAPSKGSWVQKGQSVTQRVYTLQLSALVQAPFLLYFPQCTEQSQGGHSSTHFPPP